MTDAADTGENRRRIKALARGASHLFIEATFLEGDRVLAEGTRHLTARAAGEIARACTAAEVTPFHHSPRYADDPEAAAREVRAAWKGTEGVVR